MKNMTLNDYVIAGRLNEAVDFLEEPTKSLLAARISNLDRAVMLGLIKTDDATLERNKIGQSILHFAGTKNVVLQHNNEPQLKNSNKFSPSKIRSIIERNNIGDDEINELIKASNQVLEFFKEKLGSDEYLILCMEAEMAFRKFEARPKDQERKETMKNQIHMLLPDYENFVEIGNTEGDLEMLYNNASEEGSIEKLETYLKAVITKFPAKSNLYSEWTVDVNEFKSKTVAATMISKRMHEKQLCTTWINKIGKH